MAFTVIWLKDNVDVIGTPFNILSIARRHAEEFLPINHKTMGASGVRIVDDAGKEVFRKELPDA